MPGYYHVDWPIIIHDSSKYVKKGWASGKVIQNLHPGQDHVQNVKLFTFSPRATITPDEYFFL